MFLIFSESEKAYRPSLVKFRGLELSSCGATGNKEEQIIKGISPKVQHGTKMKLLNSSLKLPIPEPSAAL